MLLPAHTTMATKTDIANEVFTLLGKDLVDDIATASSPAVERFNAVYDLTLKDLLTEHEWSFSTREAELLEAPIPVPQFSEYTYYYELPLDYISIVQKNSDEDNAAYVPYYRIEGNYLLANYTPVKIKYIALIQDTTIFPPYFVEILSLRLAYKLAYALVSNSSLRSELWQLYEQKLLKARSRDSNEDKTTQQDDHYYDRAKLGSFSQTYRKWSDYI